MCRGVQCVTKVTEEVTFAGALRATSTVGIAIDITMSACFIIGWVYNSIVRITHIAQSGTSLVTGPAVFAAKFTRLCAVSVLL